MQANYSYDTVGTKYSAEKLWERSAPLLQSPRQTKRSRAFSAKRESGSRTSKQIQQFLNGNNVEQLRSPISSKKASSGVIFTFDQIPTDENTLLLRSSKEFIRKYPNYTMLRNSNQMAVAESAENSLTVQEYGKTEDAIKRIKDNCLAVREARQLELKQMLEGKKDLKKKAKKNQKKKLAINDLNDDELEATKTISKRQMYRILLKRAEDRLLKSQENLKRQRQQEGQSISKGIATEPAISRLEEELRQMRQRAPRTPVNRKVMSKRELIYYYSHLVETRIGLIPKNRTPFQNRSQSSNNNFTEISLSNLSRNYTPKTSLVKRPTTASTTIGAHRKILARTRPTTTSTTHGISSTQQFVKSQQNEENDYYFFNELQELLDETLENSMPRVQVPQTIQDQVPQRADIQPVGGGASTLSKKSLVKYRGELQDAIFQTKVYSYTVERHQSDLERLKKQINRFNSSAACRSEVNNSHYL